MAFVPTGTTSIVNTVPSSVIVGASIFGLPPVNVVNTNLNVSGSVVAFQGTSPFIITGSVQTSGGSTGNSSVQVLNFPANQSVSGTVGTQQTGTVITSINGVTAFPNSDSAAIQNNLPVAAFPVVFNGTNWDRLRGNSSIGALVSTGSSSVIVSQGTNPWVITGSVQTSGGTTGNSSVQLLAGSAVIGSVAILQGTNPIIITGSVQTTISGGGNSSVQLLAGSATIGSVVIVQGTNPIVITGSVQTSGGSTGNSSVQVLNFPANTSVSGTLVVQGQVAPSASIIGNPVYVGGTDGNGSIQGARLVTVSSIAQGNAWLGYVDTFSSIKAVLQPTSIVFGNASTVNTAATQIIPAPGSGLKTYITNIQISNTGSVATLVTFTDADASIIGRTIAPGGGGSNMMFLTPMVGSANQAYNMTAQTPTSVLYGAFYGYKAP